MRRSALAILALLLAATSARAQDDVTPPEEPAVAPDPYQEAYDAASALAAQGQWREAAEKFREAVALRSTAVGLFNLAQAERNAGELTKAHEHFRQAKAAATQESAADVGRLATSALKALSTQIPKLRIRVPPGAEARVDDQPVDTTAPVLVDPGAHRVVVTAAGQRAFVRELSIAEGQSVQVVATFERPKPRPHKPAPRPAPVEVQSGPPAGAIILGGVGAAALVGGLVFHLRRNEKLADAASNCVRRGDGWACPPSLENDPAHREARDQAATAEIVRNVLLGVGAAAVATGGVWWALSDGGERTPPTAVAVGPTVGGAAARLRMSF